MNTEKFEFIKQKLGKNYLNKLDIDKNKENNIPAYEFINLVCSQFEILYPSLNKEFDNAPIDIPESFSKDDIVKQLKNNMSLLEAVNIYIDYVNHYKDYSVSKNFFSQNFKNKQLVILNQAKYTYGSINKFVKFLLHNKEKYTHNFNNNELLNHIVYIAKSLILQYYLKSHKLSVYNNRYYFN